MSTPRGSSRPLSPHLQVYRWQYTMALSILHRATGCALSVGLILFIYWLAALAGGEGAYAQARELFAHPLTQLALVGLSFAFFYHFMNGIRHLMWDTGHGLERRAARLSGWIAFLAAVICTLAFWAFVLTRDSGVQP